jgi:hypothetical protein
MMTTQHCLRCGEKLGQPLEKEDGDWFVRCLSCGARNILGQLPLTGFVPELLSDVTFIGWSL